MRFFAFSAPCKRGLIISIIRLFEQDIRALAQLAQVLELQRVPMLALIVAHEAVSLLVVAYHHAVAADAVVPLYLPTVIASRREAVGQPFRFQQGICFGNLTLGALHKLPRHVLALRS